VTAEDGDVALAAKALAQFKREHNLLDFKGGVMNGEPLSAEQIADLARLPARDVLHGQLVGMIAAPITGLVRTLNALISGLAIQLRQIADEGMVPVGGAPAEDAPAEESAAPEEGDPAEAEQAAQTEQAQEEAARSAEDEETESSSEESAPAGAEAAGEESEETGTPSEGDEE
jgi:large subunit ribosomal protein L10